MYGQFVIATTKYLGYYTAMNFKQHMIFSATLLAMALAASVAWAGNAHVRDGWQLGFSYGYSAGRITFANEAEGTGEGGATPQIRLGHSVGRHFALGVEYNGWMLEGGDADLKIRSSLQQVLLAGTWYPGQPDRAGGGFYVRAGIGLGWGSVAEVEIFDQIQEHGVRVDETGLGILTGIGYEFRIVKDVAAGLGVGFNHLSIDKDFYDSGWFMPVTGTLAWYWN